CFGIALRCRRNGLLRALSLHGSCAGEPGPFRASVLVGESPWLPARSSSVTSCWAERATELVRAFESRQAAPPRICTSIVSCPKEDPPAPLHFSTAFSASMGRGQAIYPGNLQRWYLLRPHPASPTFLPEEG